MKYSKAEIEQHLRKITKEDRLSSNFIDALAFMILQYPREVEAATDLLMFADVISPETGTRIDGFSRRLNRTDNPKGDI